MAIGATTDTNGSLTKRQRYELTRAALLTERTTFDSHWRELGDFLLPRRIRFTATDRNKGDKRNSNIVDSTGRFAARTLQSGMHAGLTSPARPWMRLTTPDPELAEHPQVKRWLHEVTRRMLTIFLRSNLYNALPTLYGDLGVFGTGAIAVLEDEVDLIRCYNYPLGSYALSLDGRGLPCTWVREYELTVRQVVETFGTEDPVTRLRSRDIDWRRFSSQVKTLWDNGDYNQPVTVCWIVTRNEYANPERGFARYLPWHSCWFESGREEDGPFLRESGYHEFPILVPRWDVTGEDTYGTDCPGMTALPDVKALQIMQKRKAKAVDKGLDPPLVGPSSLRNQKTSLLPGDVTYADAREGMQGLKPIHEVRLEGLQFITADVRETQFRIQRAFYEDLFLMLQQSDPQRGAQPVTAREIQERHEEKLIALGPVLERTNDELLDPLIDRVFAIMLRGGLIPEPPAELENVELSVEYLSFLAQAQKLTGAAGLDRFLTSAASLATVFPSVRHKVNADQAIDEYADIYGVPPAIVRTDEEAAELADAEAQAMREQAMAEQVQKLGSGVAALSKASLEGDTALTRVAAAMGA